MSFTVWAPIRNSVPTSEPLLAIYISRIHTTVAPSVRTTWRGRSRAQSMNSDATGLSVRFFSVMIKVGIDHFGSTIESTLICR